ncbi:MAG: toll/interleukin-1 receptor domain-containing protein [Vicinamibacterales bacterium]
MAHDVFISHSSKDKPTADAACARLEARGLRCWIAPRDVPPGAHYGAAIIDAIRGSRVMVLVLSAHANASHHIPNEIERAVSHGVTVLPFRIEDVQPAKALDFFIGSVHWLDAMTPPLDRHLDQLADSVSRLLAVEAEAAARPVPVPPPPPPRPDVVKVAAIAVAAVALAALAWLVVGRRGGDDVAHSSATGVPAPDIGAPDTPGADPPVGEAAALVGCWRYANNATVEVRPDGTTRTGPFDGTWRGSGRRFTLVWPEPVDTLTLSADGRRLNGANQYGIAVNATRVSGGPALAGSWLWGGVLPVDLSAGGTATLGGLRGRWTLADRGRRIYRVTWPRIEEQVTLSEDFSRLSGANQYGAAVSGTRLPGC